MINRIVVLLGIALLTSCAATDVITVHDVKYIPIVPPKVFYTQCEIPSPPTIEEYIHKETLERESMLTTYILQLLGTLNECNSKLYNLDLFIDKATDEINLKNINAVETDK